MSTSRVHQYMTMEQRLVAQITFTPSCWEWNGTITPSGYGRIRHNGKSLMAHRLTWELAHGPIPDGKIICHHCDNPRCVRVEHLFLGTFKDNTLDMVRKGRDYNGHQKLTLDEIIRAKALSALGFSTRKIAALIGKTGRTNIRNAINKEAKP